MTPAELRALVAKLRTQAEYRGAECGVAREEYREWQAADAITALLDQLAEAERALVELASLVRGECPSLLDEDSGGNSRLSIEIDAAIAAQGKS